MDALLHAGQCYPSGDISLDLGAFPNPNLLMRPQTLPQAVQVRTPQCTTMVHTELHHHQAQYHCPLLVAVSMPANPGTAGPATLACDALSLMVLGLWTRPLQKCQCCSFQSMAEACAYLRTFNKALLLLDPHRQASRSFAPAVIQQTLCWGAPGRALD